MKKYAQSLAMLLATVVMAVLALYRDLGSDGMSPSEWVTVVIAVFTTLVVWAAANVPGFEKAKTLVSAIGLVLNLLVAAIVGGISTDEWMFLAIQFLGALGVAAVPKVVWNGAPTINGTVVR